MKRFIIRSVLYLSPLIIVIMAVYVIDPYYLFGSNKSFNEQKYEIGYSFDQGRRYKIFTFWNNPSDKIILGASEINLINERNIPEDGWHSLSYGGAPLQESLRMYWEASQLRHLTKVIIAPEFIKYFNAISSANGDPYYTNFQWENSQSAKALEIYNNSLDYFIDKYTLESTWVYFFSHFSNSSTRGKPSTSKADFWTHQMNYAQETYRGNSVFDEKKEEIMNLFRLIKDDAERNGTEILIVIPIQHTDLLKEEYSDNIYPIYVDYIKSLTSIFGGIYYMAFYKGLSDDDKLFSDPFHFTSTQPYIEGLFGPQKMEKLSNNETEKYLAIIKETLKAYE